MIYLIEWFIQRGARCTAVPLLFVFCLFDLLFLALVPPPPPLVQGESADVLAAVPGGNTATTARRIGRTFPERYDKRAQGLWYACVVELWCDW